jgi:4-diphosphocytidyl-2-C-methyl-D-erythritol kinase
MRSLTVAAPAKLNLFLHVTGRRADGYHLLETAMVALDLADAVTVARREDGAVHRAGGWAGVPEEQDLAVRAALALKAATGCASGADLTVEKRIPVGGGMGGGSSDAAAILLALDRLWALGLTRARLAEVGLALGADVPFFLHAGPAFASGVGEVLRAVTLPPRWAAVIVPPVAVSTAAIFAAPELTRNTRSAKINVFSEGYGRNDLEPIACARHPEISTALAVLRRRDPRARMTGSGSAVFGLFASIGEAEAAIAARPPGTRGFVARTLDRHPLAAFA